MGRMAGEASTSSSKVETSQPRVKYRLRYIEMSSKSMQNARNILLKELRPAYSRFEIKNLVDDEPGEA
jgi:hypothetical protein